MEFAFWNTLHDGGIDAITGDVPGDITLTVGIMYLCAELPTTASSLRVSLLGCTLLSYTPYDESAITDPKIIVSRGVEVLSADLRIGRVEVCCSGGTLEASYQGVEIHLIEGGLVSQLELELAAERYWSAWAARNKRV